MGKILFLFKDIPRVKAYLQRIGSEELVLCPLTFDIEVIDATKKIFSDARVVFQLVPFIKLFNEKAFEIREDYIKFTAGLSSEPFLGGRNLKEYFRYPGKNFSLWWFSSVFEKNTFKTDAYHKLVQFLTILDIQKEYRCGIIIVELDDQTLCRCLKDNAVEAGYIFVGKKFLVKKALFYAISRGLFYVFIFLKKKMVFSTSSPLKKSRCPFLFVTYFPVFDEEALKNGQYINSYFGPLQRALEQKYSCKEVTWLALNAFANDYDWERTRRAVDRIKKQGYDIISLERWLFIKDIISVLLVYLSTVFKYFIKRGRIKEVFRYKWNNRDLKIWNIFEKDWDNSFAGWVMLEGMLYYKIFLRAFSEYKNKSIIYMAEMQAWEKSLNIAAKEQQMEKVIGIQHTIVPLLLLTYFNGQADLEYKDMMTTMPKPDYLGCVGKIPERFLRDNGWDDSHMFIFGATRFQHYINYFNKKIAWSAKKNRAVVTFCICPSQAKEVMHFVWQALGSNPNFEVILKGHYANALDFSAFRLPSHFRVSKEPLSVLLPEAKVIVVTESSSVLEGLACRCVPVIPLLPGVVDLNPLSGISDIPHYARSPLALRNIVEKIIQSQESPLNYQEVKEFLCAYCDFLENDQEYLEKIEGVFTKNFFTETRVH